MYSPVTEATGMAECWESQRNARCQAASDSFLGRRKSSGTAIAAATAASSGAGVEVGEETGASPWAASRRSRAARGVNRLMGPRILRELAGEWEAAALPVARG